jgi:hypothetical protein
VDSGQRLAPSTVVECETFAAKISAACCVSRHLAREPSGGGRGSPVPELRACARCAIGAARAAELVRLGRRPKRFQRFSIQREAVQRAARDRLHRSGALYRDGIPTIDGAPE